MKLGKITAASKGRAARWYEDACGTALGLELVGERWALLILRELMFGPRRFGELKADLVGISANVLTQRLEGLEAAGILHRRRLPPPAAAPVYELTPWGYEAEPAIQALGRWAVRSPRHDPTLPLSAAAIMLSLRTMMNSEASRALPPCRIAFQFGEVLFLARLEAGHLAIRREAGEANLLWRTDPMTLAALVYGKRPIEDAEAAGQLALTGDRALASRFIDLFELPEKAGRP
ncbi:helix-turn-helix domain-containing protein [Aureimonas sp. AU20]|uniref:winged helix-turn-helix transcriptional regulator n=1 Tax=Aureimonas sp. AU20 TaxID=1349819 RepID=UPI000721DE62|nr:helix-turn-helix domain-containing protein [Aureimonas sp. AU20]ALN74915.1 hypothetical protein M673_19500 [Aureimonas sp. AU20]